jgi:hypothetical protein
MNIWPSPCFKKVVNLETEGGWDGFKMVISSSFRDIENQIKLNSVCAGASLSRDFANAERG